MTREELLNGYKEDVRDFAKECLRFEGELDATFFNNWAEHFTNLAERFWLSHQNGTASKREMKMSGIIAGLNPNYSLIDYRNILLDCGGITTLSDFILNKFGEYKEGDRITITVTPCGENEHYYPPRPNFCKNDNINMDDNIIIPEEK